MSKSRRATVPAILDAAETLERAGSMDLAAEKYLEAIELARKCAHLSAVIRSLRRLAIVRHLQGDELKARELCEKSFREAQEAGDDVLAAEALNTLGVIDFDAGNVETARHTYAEALRLGGADRALRARIEQNLGILSNMQGDLDTAASHYLRSLDAFQSISDARGCGIVYHNLGMVYADREKWQEAEAFFENSREIAEAQGDEHLEALCSLNQAEVNHACGSYENALSRAQSALRSFERMGANIHKADSYRVIGMVYRDTARHVLAEARLKAARDLSVECGSALSEADACRELALLYQAMGRNQDALKLLNAAYRLYSSLEAKLDLVDVGGKREKLEETYLAVVREWGQSIESSDSYTYGHCGRVAEYAVAVATQLGLDASELTAIELGAYLHDLGKIKVAHEILNKPGKLTNEEFDVIKKHPEWGVELLDGIEFPWDIKPIILWHHERFDGTGYPHGLKGDEIPLAAQILCIADVYDALTTTRSYRGAMPQSDALARMAESRHWWRAEVYQAFMEAIPGKEETQLSAAA